MPNHCMNMLWVHYGYDNAEALRAHFRAAMGLNRPNPQFDFDAIIPYPDPYKTMDDEMRACGSFFDASPAAKAKRELYKHKWGHTNDGFNSGGYEWCRANWGTKWGAYDVKLVEYGRMDLVLFQTAWSPPTPVIKAAAAKFPAVRFELHYAEMGCSFSGTLVVGSNEDGTPYVVETTADNYRGFLGG